MSGLVHGLLNFIGGGDRRAPPPPPPSLSPSAPVTQPQSNHNSIPNTYNTLPPPPEASPSAPKSRPRRGGRGEYISGGDLNIKGLTNQTGYVKGNANGAINFGSLNTGA
ncbi:hypothetical protein O6P43_003661 [Quillaja saponaria]|uniref:Uncharacterized protein n=1 Tax=Quillaja saponaria TaxID=32244 RepID=A0AAD7VLU2_QUISA|nr:hypothetical protein O6P43_003661 [Quillaja saponaria]